ncbi:MAG: 2TM domain-containing protein [Chloroflexi bacterium]|nr:2TM domain-containing protein [Chloroflexota bacterium]
MDTQSEAYERAKKRVKEIKDFWSHLAWYISICVFLTIVDLVMGDGVNWAYWVYLGWGIGVVAHAYSTYGPGQFFDENWEERKIQELMAKDTPEKPKRGIDA